MKTFNVTAQVYSKQDIYKQTIFMNEVVAALCDTEAKETFEQIYGKTHNIVKVYSIEEISTVSS